MNVFWSSTDTETIKSIGKNGMCAATVFNKKDEMRSAICYKTSHQLWGDTTQLVDDVPTVYEYIPDARIPEWDAEFVACVKERKYELVGTLPGSSEAHQPWLGNYKDKKTKLSKEDYDWGIIGLGVDVECAYLKVPRKRYVKDIVENNTSTIMAYDMKLQAGIDSGELVYHNNILGVR